MSQPLANANAEDAGASVTVYSPRMTWNGLESPLVVGAVQPPTSLFRMGIGQQRASSSNAKSKSVGRWFEPRPPHVRAERVALQDDDEDGADLITLSGWSTHP